MRPSLSFAACAFALLLIASPLRAQTSPTFTAPTTSESFSSPRPGGLLPRGLFDPSRFTLHTSLSMGYTSGGGPYGGSAGLFTSSLGYRVSGNSMLRVDVGAHMNPAFGGGGTEKGIFLQGAMFDWKPTHNSLVRVEYRDLRSPLQYGYGGYGYGYAPYGYGARSSLFREDESPLGSGQPGDPLRN